MIIYHLFGFLRFIYLYIYNITWLDFVIFRARQSLVDVYQAITAARLSPPQITFTGLSHFNNTVLYIDPVKDGHLDQLTRIAGWMKWIFL